MGVITTTAFPKALRPGVFAFTQLMYNEHTPFWPELFNTQNSTLSYEELVSGNGFGLVPATDQGEQISYMTESQGNVTRSTHVKYAAGFAISFEEAHFNQYEKVGTRRGQRLATAFRRTEEVVHANFFNRAFNSSYAFGDGKELCATDHPSLNGTWQNEPTVGVNLSEAAIEDMWTLMRKATDNVGNKVSLNPKLMVYGSSDAFNATRILESEKQNDTANNAKNALKSKGIIPKHMDNPYFDDGGEWFILADIAPTDGLIHFNAVPFRMMKDNDNNTLVEKSFGFMMYSVTVGDPRAVWGSPGQ